MIREIHEPEFLDVFFDLMAEVECGRHFDGSKESHVQWLRRRVAVHYFRGTRFFALEEDGTPIGFAAVLVEPPLDGAPCFAQYSELLDIGLLPEHRGKGHGRRLLAHAEVFARESDAYCLYMATYARNHDRVAFYGKSGFTPVATLPDVFGPGDEGRIYMRKILREQGA